VPRAKRDPRPKQDLSDVPKSEFIQLVEQYLEKAKCNKRLFTAELDVRETQYYRWASGANIPSKAMVTRIAVHLARHLDEAYQELPHNASPYSDTIDGLLNELFVAAGYSASIRGRPIDASWQEILQKRTWRIGYTDVDPHWAEQPEQYGEKPTGKAIKGAEQIGNFLGIRTEWHYLKWGEMPLAIAERKVHGIAPFVLAAPGRCFDYRLSEPWLQGGKFKLCGVALPGTLDENLFLEDVSPRYFLLSYISNEIGEWIVNVLGNVYEREKNPPSTKKEAIEYLRTFQDAKEDSIKPILFSDKFTCEGIAKSEGWELIKIRSVDSLELYPSFAVHPEEEKLAQAINSVLKMINSIPETSQNTRSN
jgi:hypothetical protein